MVRAFGLLLIVVVLPAVGCATRHGQVGEARGPKVLFEWASASKEEEDTEREEEKGENGGKEKNGKDKNGENGPKHSNGNGNGKNGSGKNGASENGAEPEEDEIVTDRPDFTESSSTVGRGRVQLEMGYTFIRDRMNGERVQSHSYPEMLLRVGMFAEWFEVRLGQNFANERTTSPTGERTFGNGAEDTYLGVKFALTEQKEWRPEMALMLQMTVPTGARAFSAREVLPGFNWLYGWDVVEDCLSFGGSTQMNRVRNTFALPALIDGTMQEGQHSHLELAQSLTIGYSLTPKLGAYTEWFGIFPHSAIGPDMVAEHYLNGGFTYLIRPLFQVDVRAGFGLNRHADDFFAGTGFAIKF